MKSNYPKISFENLIEKGENWNFINFMVFPESAKIVSSPSFQTPFLLEGVFFALCIKGSANLSVNSKNYSIVPDTVLVLQPGQLIHITDMTADFLIQSMYISVDFFIGLPAFRDSRYFFYIHKYPCVKVPGEVSRNFLEYYSFIIKRYNRINPLYKDEIIQGLLYAMTMEYLAICDLDIPKEEHKFSKRQEKITDDFLALLMEHCNLERNVGFYAGKLCVTPKYLSATIRQTTGRSVLEWIHEMFIINSKMLLKSTNKTISEICDELNVSNDSFFCRFFREQTGMSPMQYRNSA